MPEEQKIRMYNFHYTVVGYVSNYRRTEGKLAAGGNYPVHKYSEIQRQSGAVRESRDKI